VNIFLWSLQAVLAAFFVLSGLGKALQPKEKLVGKYPVLDDYSQATVRFIGGAELLGGIGLVLPAAVGVAAVLTPTAGVGLAVMMLLAAVVHQRRGEAPGVGFTVVLCVLAAVVSWGRYGPYSW
jgi:hypothetical protein